jgi:hypothetical protein
VEREFIAQARKEAIMPSLKTLIIGGVICVVLAIWLISCFGNNEPVQEPLPTPTSNAFLDQTNDGLEPTATIPATADSSNWDCEIINSQTASGFDASLPVIPNAFRAIEKAADPSVWESGPFKWIDRYDIERIVETRPELSIVHNGDLICVMP